MPIASHEIFRSYLRRFLGSWFGWIIALMLAVQIVVGSILLPMNPVERMVFMLFSGLFLTAMLWIHFREIVVNSQRILMPAPIGPHVLVVTGWLLIVMIGWPLISYWRVGLGLATLACMATGTALLGVWILTMSPLIFIVAFALWLGLISGWAEAPLTAFLTGGHEWRAGGMLLGALAVIAIVITRMVRLTEEDPLFFRQINLESTAARPRMTGQRDHSQTDLLAIRWPGWSRMLFLPQGSGLWSRARRRSILVRRGAITMLLTAPLGEVAFRLPFMPAELTHVCELVLLMFSVFLPTVFLAENWLKQWRYLEIEILRPGDRASFLKELGLAIGLDYLAMWLSIVVVIVADALIFGSMIGLYWLALALCGSLSIQVVFYGIQVWIMRYRSLVVIFASMMMVGIPAILLPIIAAHNVVQHQAIAATIATALAIGGVLLARDGYHRWLVTDLG